MQAEALESIWGRIDAWLARQAPDILADLNPPASPEALSDTEARIGRELPEDVRATFQIHDGQRGSAPWSFPEWKLLPIRFVAQELDVLRELRADGVFDHAVARAEGPVHATWWSQAWIPLLANGYGDYLCVDVDPPEGGRIGQLLQYWGRHETREVVAPSLRAWLTIFADDLEAGRISRDERGSMVRISK
jgi:cell wall assembly regulator SMI1